MGASEQAGQHPARGAARLEPGDCADEQPDGGRPATSLVPIEQDVLGALTPDGRYGSKEDRREAAEIAERLARLTADRDSVAEFKAMNFTGSKFEIFRADLAAYGYPVIRSWIRRRLIYKLTKDRGQG